MIKTVEQLNENIASCTKCLEDKITGADGKRHIVLCGGTGCLSNHSKEIRERFVEVLAAKGLSDQVTVNQVGCFGFCSQGPFVKIFPEDTLYRLVKIEDVEEIVETDIIGKQVVDRLLYVEPSTGEKVSKQDDINFYKKQRRVALHGCGVINPEEITEALGMGGFQGLKRALSMDRQAVIDEMLRIPYGATTSYGDIARAIAKKRGGRVSAQAVGGAVGWNPICIIIPCHRVIGADGSLTGYGGGLGNKASLLAHEGLRNCRMGSITPIDFEHRV